MTSKRALGLIGLGGLAFWGLARARLTFGAIPATLTLVFDGSCDLCTQVIRRLRALDARERVTMVPFQRPGFPESHGLTVAQCEESIWAITPDGAPFRAAAAASLSVSVILGSPLPAWLYGVPGIQAASEASYGWIARNRNRLPGDRPYCEQHPEECGGPRVEGSELSAEGGMGSRMLDGRPVHEIASHCTE